MITKFLALLLLTSILVIGVFGFATMNHSIGHSASCVASAVDSTHCPQNIVAMTVHHIQAYLTFFSAIPVSPILVLMLLLTLLLSARSLFVPIKYKFDDPDRKIIYKKSEAKPLALRKLIRWLSLFENSPSFA